MAFLKIENVAIRGVSAFVPSKVEENKDLIFYGPGEAEQVMAATGIERRHVATDGITASDLCYKAAEELLSMLGWERESVDLLAFVTQCPDYVTLPNSFIVHHKLSMREDCICLDFYHGCPGWVVALSSVTSMMSTGTIKRAILLVGDTCSQIQYANNREEKPLIGDAGSVTALEFDHCASAMLFDMGTQSDDAEMLVKPYGGFRSPYTQETLKYVLDLRSGKSSDFSDAGQMDGMGVFSFAISKPPKSIKKLCSEYRISLENIDNLFLHQGNKIILENIAKRLKMPMEKVPSSLRNYGNTTSVSIPLTIVTERDTQLSSSRQKNIACAFGTGMAWGTVYFETQNIVVPQLIVL